MRIGILGGSFNPPHNGHLYLGRNFHTLLSLDRIFVIPAGIPPHKAAVGLASNADRMAMCSVLFSDPYFTVSDIELKRSGKSYTVDTVTQIKALYPDDELFLLVGADMLLYFDKWFRWQDILKLCTLCAFARDGEHDAAALQDYADRVLKSDKVRIEAVPPFAVSSTRIRACLAAGEAVDGLLPAELIEYINKKGLYRENGCILS